MGDLFASGIAGWQVIGARHEGVNHAEVHAHVPRGLAAHGAGVVVARVLPKAVAVHEVATGQLLHHQSVSLPVSLPVSQSVCQSNCQSVCQSVCLSEDKKETTCFGCHVGCIWKTSDCICLDAQVTGARLAADSSGMRAMLQHQLSTKACRLPMLLKAYPSN